ncbi:MAG TPA: hypothetical protein PL181_15515 [bacterium]|nr:hypothetical protein [bacterium]
MLRSAAVHRDHAQADLADLREMAGHAFSRAAGAPLIPGNQVRLLKDAAANYPAWLEAIAAAQHHIHLESYIIYDDETGSRFASALMARARQGIRVCVLYDWLGGVGKSSPAFWHRQTRTWTG